MMCTPKVRHFWGAHQKRGLFTNIISAFRKACLRYFVFLVLGADFAGEVFAAGFDLAILAFTGTRFKGEE